MKFTNIVWPTNAQTKLSDKAFVMAIAIGGFAGIMTTLTFLN